MADINLAAVLVAAVASLAASGIWYAVFGDAMMRLQDQWRGVAVVPGRPEAWRMLVFLAVALVLSVVVAVLIDMAEITGWAESAGFGVLLWTGFVLTQWIGSIAGEGVPVRLAAIHAGDWLLHLLIIATIVGVWR